MELNPKLTLAMMTVIITFAMVMMMGPLTKKSSEKDRKLIIFSITRRTVTKTKTKTTIIVIVITFALLGLEK